MLGQIQKLQSEFGKSANSMMDNTGSLAMMNAKVSSMTIPNDFKGNPDEYRRRSKEGLQRLVGDEYMLAVQNQTRFDLKATLDKIPKTDTPAKLNERAATIENRVITAGEKIDPTQRLRSATMDTQQKFLEEAAISLRDEKMKTGTVAADGAIKDYAQNSYKGGLLPADVANYAMLTEGVEIPQDTINTVAAIPKPADEQKMANVASVPAPKTAPAPSTP